MSKLKNFLNKITIKQILMIIIFGIAISVISCIIGYFEFSNTIRNIYDNEVTEIANYVIENIDLTEYEKNMKILEKNFYELDVPEFDQISQQPGYQKLAEQMGKLQKSIEGLDIFIANFDESYKKDYMAYLEKGINPGDAGVLQTIIDGNEDIICSYYRSPDLVPENRKKDTPGGIFLADAQEQESLHKLYNEKTRQYLDSSIVMGDTNETFSLFSVNEPIINDQGDVIGFVNVSITIGVIHKLLTRYLFLVGFLTILIGIIFIFIYIHVNRKLFLNPILSIIQGTSNFVQNNNKITESLTKIKTGDEIQTLAESILKLETDINDYIKNLAEATKERERVQTELDLATDIQMSMLPQEIPEIAKRDEFEISAIMNPAREVGGDFYNYYMIDDDHLGFVIGDVSGKGVPAALFMMMGTILIKTQSLPEDKANEIIERANDILSDNNAADLFITVWMGIYEISTGLVTFINAGHEPPVLVHENGEVELVKTKPNLPLGSFGGLPYRLNKLQMKKGDKIFLYTDGVAEAQNANQDMYEIDRLVKTVKSVSDKDVREIIKLIREDVDVFVNGAEQFDDITIVGLEIKKDPSSSQSE